MMRAERDASAKEECFLIKQFTSGSGLREGQTRHPPKAQASRKLGAESKAGGLCGRLRETNAGTEGQRAGRVRGLGERCLDDRPPEVSEQDERTRRGVP